MGDEIRFTSSEWGGENYYIRVLCIKNTNLKKNGIVWRYDYRQECSSMITVSLDRQRIVKELRSSLGSDTSQRMCRDYEGQSTYFKSNSFIHCPIVDTAVFKLHGIFIVVF